jgi:sugar (pentulose or hexulose) kinase
MTRIERTFEPDFGARHVYDERYPAWRSLYARILDLSEIGLPRPMWWPAGA